MANDKRFITKNGLQAPNIDMVSPTGANNITADMYDSGTLSFDGSAGQLFSLTNSFTGTIFSVNDSVGVPLIEADDNGTVSMVSYGGSVGIGTGAPATRLHVSDNASDGTIQLGGTSTTGYYGQIKQITNDLQIISNGDQGYRMSLGTNNGTGNITFLTATGSTGNTERMRINAAGDVIIGASSKGGNSGKLHVEGSLSAKGTVARQGVNGTSNGNLINFWWIGSSLQAWVDSTNVGNIGLSSDYRIKQKITTQTANALDRVMQLRPVSYEFQDYKNLFKADGILREGFIAHELAEVVPSAVEGEKDDENQIQSLKLDALVSVLTSAIQELSAKVDALQSELNTLKEK